MADDLSWLNEPVDENGYLLSADEEWGAHGIYPPPLCGSPTPESVARIKRHQAEWAALTPQEREERRQRARAFIQEWDRGNGGPPLTRASRLS